MSFWETGVCVLDCDGVGVVLFDEDCDENVWCYCHRKDREVGVVDMLALALQKKHGRGYNQIDPARGSDDMRRTRPIELDKLVVKTVKPKSLFLDDCGIID